VFPEVFGLQQKNYYLNAGNEMRRIFFVKNTSCAFLFVFGHDMRLWADGDRDCKSGFI
jgi:hypothetical protein